MRVYLQRAGYSLQQDGTLTRPDETKRKEYFNAVIAEWTAFQNKGNHGFYTGGFEQLFRGYSEGILNSQESLWEIAFNPTGAGYKDNAGTWATYNGPAVEAPGKMLLLMHGDVPMLSSVYCRLGKTSLKKAMNAEM